MLSNNDFYYSVDVFEIRISGGNKLWESGFVYAISMCGRLVRKRMVSLSSLYLSYIGSIFFIIVIGQCKRFFTVRARKYAAITQIISLGRYGSEQMTNADTGSVPAMAENCMIPQT